ncbi:hypothetical protein ACFY9N_02910 [Microbacterium sp. NPDC008134]|uniref:hypothetical protein n=1 Tax=Microbacterium sp. NPDC008134 TaxID=3364183 RepID=UPI0036E9B98F
MKAEISSLQLHIFNGEWDVVEYGDIAASCGSGYRFNLHRATPLGAEWRLPRESIRAQADDIVRWLEEKDWRGIVNRSYPTGLGTATIEASKPAAHIDDLLVKISTGKVADGISVRATGACEPGDIEELDELMFPDGFSGNTFPPTEHPTETPKFGMSTPKPGS